ncbi:MAG: hypothetical protein Q7T41_03565 [Candidatus Saccharibacteria bacterium]|nr:hypothetical protein [Candidatus Saccharibacteria bacterium]
MPWKDKEKQRQAIRNHYYANRQSYIDKAYKKRLDLRKWVYQLKHNHPCADCKQSFPYYVMDFDHLENKKNTISRLINTGSRKQVENEIAKCELVCSNCHRIRTYTRNPSKISYTD